MNTHKQSEFSPSRYYGIIIAIGFFLLPFTVGWAWGWWKFAVSSVGIIFSLGFSRPDTFVSDLGLRLRKADFVHGSLSLLIVGGIACWIIPIILRPAGYGPGDSENYLWKCLATPFQVLNEEMLLRALFLTLLARLFSRPNTISLLGAFIFAGTHFLLYRLGPPHLTLSMGALTTVFLFSVALNKFFLATGNIAVPFGIHLGWNFTRFGNDWVAQSSGINISEGLDFNLIEGNFFVIVLALTLLLLAIATNYAAGDAARFKKHCR